MRISAKGGYATRAVLDLALQRERGLTTIQEIADRQGIPQRYLEQVLLALKRAGFLTSKRGSTGGHHLPAPAAGACRGLAPPVGLTRLPKRGGATVAAKLESANPGGSVKDRIAAAMIEDAGQRGLLTPGAAPGEPTSGNTGIGLAMVAAVKGYRLILTMPDDMSVERQRLLARYGAEIRLTPAIEGMTGAVHAAQELLGEHPEYFMPQQFQNPANPEVHRRTTALEILEATGGRPAAVRPGGGP